MRSLRSTCLSSKHRAASQWRPFSIGSPAHGHRSGVRSGRIALRLLLISLRFLSLGSCTWSEKRNSAGSLAFFAPASAVISLEFRLCQKGNLAGILGDIGTARSHYIRQSEERSAAGATSSSGVAGLFGQESRSRHRTALELRRSHCACPRNREPRG